ncbi:MAG: chemotaxis response regulator protein-glutamate methylesterase [Spirochaetales bacterium]|nr:chemotaxis response regulator protein-glutamate methylesterase [Spirochaetales bacterium]
MPDIPLGKNEKLKILVVDDSAVVRQTLVDIISSDKELEVMGAAQDPFIAAAKMKEQAPDVIILDIEMPRMDGLTFLQKIMSQHPIPVVICSSQAERGQENALRAIDYGAVEIIEKPKMGAKQFIEESKIRITDAVKAAYLSSRARVKRTFPGQPALKLTADAILSKPKHVSRLETTEHVVAIGASTGGTEALRQILEAMPADAPGIVIVQHMPEHFTRAFANRLDGLCTISVKEAEQNDTVIRGRALIAPGNRHMLLKRSGARYYVELRDGPLVSRHRPSVDVLFRSVARYAGVNAIGIIMTGMGDDGAKGMVEMKEAGAKNIAQDEKSCVVFGMPKEAIKLGVVDDIVSLKNIPDKILAYAKD